jgi:hypothetical protein
MRTYKNLMSAVCALTLSACATTGTAPQLPENYWDLDFWGQSAAVLNAASKAQQPAAMAGGESTTSTYFDEHGHVRTD